MEKYIESFERQKDEKLKNGTYELIGKHLNGNPYNLDADVLEYIYLEKDYSYLNIIPKYCQEK